MLDWLQGKKTHIAALALAIVAALKSAGVLTEDLANAILTIIGALTASALRAAVKKVDTAVKASDSDGFSWSGGVTTPSKRGG